MKKVDISFGIEIFGEILVYFAQICGRWLEEVKHGNIWDGMSRRVDVSGFSSLAQNKQASGSGWNSQMYSHAPSP